MVILMKPTQKSVYSGTWQSWSLSLLGFGIWGHHDLSLYDPGYIILRTLLRRSTLLTSRCESLTTVRWIPWLGTSTSVRTCVAGVASSPASCLVSTFWSRRDTSLPSVFTATSSRQAFLHTTRHGATHFRVCWSTLQSCKQLQQFHKVIWVLQIAIFTEMSTMYEYKKVWEELIRLLSIHKSSLSGTWA
jgi:hypothetical protein